MPLTKTEVANAEIMLAYIESAIKKRGYVLYRGGEVKYQYYDPEYDSFHFKVKGNIEPYYHVVLNIGNSPEPTFFEDEDEDEMSCTCIHFEENLECKHVAAALHFMLANKKSDFKKILNPENSETNPEKDTLSAFPISFECTEAQLQNLHELIPTDPKSKLIYAELVDVVLLEYGIRYIISGYSYRDNLEITYKSGKITLDGTLNRPHLVKSGLHWLKDRFRRTFNRDAQILTKKQRDSIIRKDLQEMGVLPQLKKPMEALEFVLDNEQIILVTTGELSGLKNIKVFSDILNKHLQKPIFKGIGKELLLDHNETDIGVYNAGFGLSHDYHGNIYEIIPFMAKGTKNDPGAFSVKFERLQGPNDVRLSKNQHLDKALYQADQFQKALNKKSGLNVFEQFGEFVKTASGYPLFVFLGEPYESRQIRKSHFKAPLEVQPAKAKIQLSKIGVLFTVETQVIYGEQEMLLSEIAEHLTVTNAYAVYSNKLLLLFEDQKVLKMLAFLKKDPFLQVLESEFEAFFEKILLPMAAYIEINDKTGTLREAENTGPLQRQLYISELNGLIILRPQVKYGENAFSNPLDQGSIIDPENKTIYLRDEDFEDEFVDFLKTLHPNFKNSGSQGMFHLNQDSFLKDLWFYKAFDQLKNYQVRVFGLDQIKIKKYNPYPPAISMEFGSTQDWFEVQATVAFGDQKVKLRDIKKALDRNQEFIELADGSIGILPQEWVKKFGKLFRSGDTDKNGFMVPKTLFHVLDEFEEAKSFPEIIKEIEEKKEKLRAFTQIQKAEIPKKLKAELRNYQHTGLNWLNFLQEYNWGGILADDMGLGKTLQMIALICKIAESNKKAKILVVAPTTLLFNWKDELEKFAPHLDYFIHHGNRYETVDEFSKHQVILTSYGLVINDLELLQKIHFDAIIADESQAIKNTQSLRYKAITKLNGKIKMAMTGTPIENSLTELFAQMNFVNPGFFHSFNGFKDNYLKPLKNGDREILKELQHKIKPFVLRRTKEEVLTELPDKTEEHLYCVMNPLQRKIYDAYRNEYRDYLLKKFEEEGAENSKMYVLEGLTKLRLACDATNLVSHTEPKNESVKIDLLIEHILEKTGKHKILVFSQFVKMLSLVQSKLEENLIDYAYLDGSTTLKNREKTVQQFQNDENKRVFLISIKAGGTGLNLTAADYVYVLDPWWNPAVENQAIDRCYRMGQEKHVIAYRMICKDTVEEKIMLLQQAKSKLAKEVIAEGDSFLGALDKESMLSLFE
jgi:SNF2 family DNA or RNA helicase